MPARQSRLLCVDRSQALIVFVGQALPDEIRSRSRLVVALPICSGLRQAEPDLQKSTIHEPCQRCKNAITDRRSFAPTELGE